MEFPADAITNINVINGFSTIYWRIYTEERLSDENGPPDKYSILKYLSRMKDLEIKLRNQDCLVSTHPKRFCLWVFSATPGFESLRVASQDAPADLTKLTIGSTTIKVSASGHVTAAELTRTLSREPVSPEHPTQWVSNLPAAFGDAENRALALFAAFISSVAGAMGLQLIRRHNAIPLGTRSFFTPVHDNFYDSPFIAGGDPTSVPALTNLDVDLTAVGKVIIFLRTVHQGGISCLRDAGLNAGAVDASSNIDVWLAPNGTVARLVSLNGDQSRMFARRQPANDAASRAAMEAKQRIWKSTVLDWLSNIGLPVGSVDDEHWVEVEVFEPFYSTYAAEYTRQIEDVPSSSPLRRILWPSRYCFTRTTSKNALDVDTVDGLTNELDDPLQFVEDWLNAPKPRMEKSSSSIHHGTQNKDMPTPRVDIPESLESLARASQYPDLQLAGLVYPTPPDGALVPGAVYNTDNPGGEPPESAATQAAAETSASKQGEQGKPRSGSEVTSSVLARNTLGVASGHYDATGDEDLFNDKDFGTRDITDADFNFFDDPNSNSLDDPVVKTESNEPAIPEPSDVEKPQTHSSLENVAEEQRENHSRANLQTRSRRSNRPLILRSNSRPTMTRLKVKL
ncbi:hypothetical protein VTN31DRAFT_2409 [Thermomyces dupontii]|uniref:uncharacterized protein n=1 Tax=Talaromyces thermophilus TaxID=28565 RepID=UPI003743F280